MHLDLCIPLWKFVIWLSKNKERNQPFLIKNIKIKCVLCPVVLHSELMSSKVHCLCPCVEGMLVAWVFDECDATGQQRTFAVLFSRAFRPGSAACGGASDAYVPLAASSLQTGKAWTAGLNSLLTPLLYGASLLGQALCVAFWYLPPHPPGSSEYHGQAHLGNTVVPPRREIEIYVKRLAA